MLKDKELWSILRKVAVPIALQNLLMSLLNMIDTVMIGALGDLAVASVGLANQIFFILNLVIFGITSGTAIYVAQYFGKKDFENIKRPVAYSLVLSTAFAILFSILALMTPEFSLKLFTNDMEIVAEGTKYLRIAGWSYLMFGISFTFAVALRSTEQAFVPLVVTAAALCINTIFNYIFINGKFGFPAMGVEGAAVATLIARGTELLIFCYLVFFRKNIIAPRWKDFVFEKVFAVKYIKVITPVVLNESMWGIGVSIYNAVFGRIGKEVVAANQIARNAEQILTALCIGVGSAAAVVIGKKIGERDRKGALEYARKFSILSTVFGLVLGIILIFLSPAILKIYTVSPQAKEYAWQFLLILGIVMWIKMFNYVNIVGTLRGGGDTTFCLFLDVGAVWLIGVPLVYLTGLKWGMPIIVVMICLNAEEIVKSVFGFWRLRSNKWVNDLVN